MHHTSPLSEKLSTVSCYGILLSCPAAATHCVNAHIVPLLHHTPSASAYLPSVTEDTIPHHSKILLSSFVGIACFLLSHAKPPSIAGMSLALLVQGAR